MRTCKNCGKQTTRQDRHHDTGTPSKQIKLYGGIPLCPVCR